jgi:hypothetical protein
MRSLPFILIALSLLILQSCATQKACDKKFPPSTKIKDSLVITYKDSVKVVESVKTIIKDSVRYTAAVKDSGEVSVKENSTYKFKNENAEVIIKIVDGKLKWNINLSAIENRYKSQIDSFSAQITSYKQKDSISTHSTVIVQPAKEKHTPWYLKAWGQVKDFFAWIGLIFILYHFVRIGIKKFVLKTG